MTNLVSMCSLVYFGTVVSNESAFKTELENEKSRCVMKLYISPSITPTTPLKLRDSSLLRLLHLKYTPIQYHLELCSQHQVETKHADLHLLSARLLNLGGREHERSVFAEYKGTPTSTKGQDYVKIVVSDVNEGRLHLYSFINSGEF